MGFGTTAFRLRGIWAVLCLLVVAAGRVWAADGLPARAVKGGYQKAIENALEGWNPQQARAIFEEASKDSSVDPLLLRFMDARILFFEGQYSDALENLAAIGITVGTTDAYTAEFVRILHNVARQTGAMARYESEHFIYHVPRGKDELLLPYLIETAEAQYAALVADFKADIRLLDPKIRIEVYPDIRGFSSISSLSLDAIKTSGTVALCKYNRLMITSPRTLARGYRWRDTLGHEMVHYFLTRLTHNRVPLWLHEGISRFQEERWRNPEVGEFSIYDQSILSEARDRDYWVPLSAMEPSLALLTKPGDTGLAFAELFGIVRMIYQTGGYPLLQSMLAKFAQGASTAAVLQQVSLSGPEVLFRNFQREIRSMKLAHIPGRRILPLEEGSIDEAGWSRLPDYVRRRVLLGDQMRDRGRYRGAEQEYLLAATGVTGLDASLESKLAEARIEDGRFDAAWQGMQKALVIYDSDPRLQLAAGKAALRRGDNAQAIKYLENTLGIHPFQRELFALLAEAYESQTMDKQARRAREARDFLAGYDEE